MKTLKHLALGLAFGCTVALPFALYSLKQVDAERRECLAQLEQRTAQLAHMRLLHENRADCDLDNRLLAMQTELQTLRLGIRGIAKECGR